MLAPELLVADATFEADSRSASSAELGGGMLIDKCGLEARVRRLVAALEVLSFGLLLSSSICSGPMLATASK